MGYDFWWRQGHHEKAHNAVDSHRLPLDFAYRFQSTLSSFVKVNPPFISTQSFQHNEALVQSERQFPPQKIEPTENEKSSLQIRSGFLNGNSERSQEHHEDEADQKNKWRYW
ncbi:unnamed protein product [Lactuca virosa]|uniref:Uncharacterized protein n=1 Tax=Lactuca virosa TaxID=75947 RepID=A0AAU9N784_9ASTR|nr:unnamed protein product [Lactuca virosa]